MAHIDWNDYFQYNTNKKIVNKNEAELVKQYASLGVWILSERSQLAEAERLGADIIETNGQLKPKQEETL